jgi:hypothetical protein
LSNDFVLTIPHDYRIYRETYFKLYRPFSEKSPTYLAFVKLETKAAGMLDYATDLRYPNFAKMAEAAGVLGLKANAPEQVRPLLAQALNHPGAALVEVCSRPPGTRAAAVD